jgi:hypothetical protein
MMIIGDENENGAEHGMDAYGVLASCVDDVVV